MKKMSFKQSWFFVVLFLLTVIMAVSAQAADKLVVKDSEGSNTVFSVDETGKVMAGQIGVGTSVPAYQIETDAEGGPNATIGMKVSSSGAGVPSFFGARSGGSLSAPSETATGKGLFWLGARGWTATNGWNSALTGLIGFWSTENFTDTAMGTEMRFYTTPNGSATRAERMRINANGTVIMNSLAGSYTNGSAYVCVNNSGQIFASETACP